MASKEGKEYIEQAIDDALKILKDCELCRQMFDSEGSNYPIDLLEQLRRDKAIIISPEAPTRWKLSANRKKLTVKLSQKLNSAAAGVVDLLERRAGEMGLPCIYVNPTGFMVTGSRAENFGLYGLEPRVQRSVALIHELAHVAGVLQFDGDEGEEPKNNVKSGANTNCV
ncbi:MAG TPA: hypothetical protein VMS31_12780, partial [Pyrinomonadaceae bacterium]|nr:hypothetical protein [Pyrinomonadaceae bacterium]